MAFDSGTEILYQVDECCSIRDNERYFSSNRSETLYCLVRAISRIFFLFQDREPVKCASLKDSPIVTIILAVPQNIDKSYDG